MDAADELTDIILNGLKILEDINASTFTSDRPTNAMCIKRWVDDMRQQVTCFNVKALDDDDCGVA